MRDAIALLDSAFAPLTPAEELDVGRAAATAGSHTRAVAAFERRSSPRRHRDRHRRGSLRLRHRAHPARPPRRGRAQFALVRAPRELAALGRLPAAPARWCARARLRRARTALARVLRLHPRDTTAASSALFLLGDLASDDRADAARPRVLSPGRRPLPQQPVRADGGVPRRDDRAARRRRPGGGRRVRQARPPLSRGATRSAPPTYWAGRAWDVAGDSAAARARWERLAAGDPGSYYTGLALRRLGRARRGRRPPPPTASSRFPAPTAPWPAPRCSPAWAWPPSRAGSTTGWSGRATPRRSGCSPWRTRSARDGLAAQAIQLARRALALGAPADARTYRLLYPVMLEDALLAEAREHGLDAGLRRRAHPPGVDVQSRRRPRPSGPAA